MTEHPRETTIELYVLGSETLSGSDRDALRRHIDRCHGCRALAERIASFYDELHREVGDPDRLLPIPSPKELSTNIR